MERTFDEIYDEVIEDLRGNLTKEEYKELITLEYVVTQGYDNKGDYERYKELSEKKIISEGKNVSGPMEFTTDISLLQKTINWKPDTDIKPGLKQTYDIMKSYLNSN
jgi:nucleoside-diphosphate-sugar epimerase